MAPASIAGNRVGYESASKFSREYRRLFGAPPLGGIPRIPKSKDLEILGIFLLIAVPSNGSRLFNNLESISRQNLGDFAADSLVTQNAARVQSTQYSLPRVSAGDPSLAQRYAPCAAGSAMTSPDQTRIRSPIQGDLRQWCQRIPRNFFITAMATNGLISGANRGKPRLFTIPGRVIQGRLLTVQSP